MKQKPQLPSGKQSSEYKTLKTRLDKIIDFLAVNCDPESLTDKLFAAGLINRSIAEEASMRAITKSQRIRPLVNTVLSLVEMNTENFGLFIQILEDIGGLDELVMLLQ